VCNFRKSLNAAAVLEWAVAFIFTFYAVSFVIDLIPAVRGKNYASRETAMQMEQNDDSASQHINSPNGNGAMNGYNSHHYTNSRQNGYGANDMAHGNGNAGKVRPANNYY
jgi:hypothetical protein